jgi:hypothetical protein
VCLAEAFESALNDFLHSKGLLHGEDHCSLDDASRFEEIINGLLDAQNRTTLGALSARSTDASSNAGPRDIVKSTQIADRTGSIQSMPVPKLQGLESIRKHPAKSTRGLDPIRDQEADSIPLQRLESAIVQGAEHDVLPFSVIEHDQEQNEFMSSPLTDLEPLVLDIGHIPVRMSDASLDSRTTIADKTDGDIVRQETAKCRGNQREMESPKEVQSRKGILKNANKTLTAGHSQDVTRSVTNQGNDSHIDRKSPEFARPKEQHLSPLVQKSSTTVPGSGESARNVSRVHSMKDRNDRDDLFLSKNTATKRPAKEFGSSEPEHSPKKMQVLKGSQSSVSSVQENQESVRDKGHYGKGITQRRNAPVARIRGGQAGFHGKPD